MNITVNGKKITILDINGKDVYKNFAGAAGLKWDKFADGGEKDRKFRIKLSPEDAEWFAAQGGKIIAFAPTEQYPDPAYYIDIRVSYKGKSEPAPGQPWNVYDHGPRIVMVQPGKPNIDLTAKTVHLLDKAFIKNVDCELYAGETRLKDGSRVMRGEHGDIPGITLYANRVYATIEPVDNELDKRYEYVSAEDAIVDAEDLEQYIDMKNK